MKRFYYTVSAVIQGHAYHQHDIKAANPDIAIIEAKLKWARDRRHGHSDEFIDTMAVEGKWDAIKWDAIRTGTAK
jgi:hypothetical protein